MTDTTAAADAPSDIIQHTLITPVKKDDGGAYEALTFVEPDLGLLIEMEELDQSGMKQTVWLLSRMAGISEAEARRIKTRDLAAIMEACGPFLPGGETGGSSPS